MSLWRVAEIQGLIRACFWSKSLLIPRRVFSKVLTCISFLFQALQRTYSTSNVLAAWKAAGIEPFNPRRVLTPKESPPKRAKFAVTGFMTPATTRMARVTSKEALSLIKGTSQSAEKLWSLIGHLDKGLPRSITEKVLGDYFHQKFRQAATKRSQANFGGRKTLTKARVITTK